MVSHLVCRLKDHRPRFLDRSLPRRQISERMGFPTRTARGVAPIPAARQEQSLLGDVIYGNTTSGTQSRSFAVTATVRSPPEEASRVKRILRDTRQNTTRASCATGRDATGYSAA